MERPARGDDEATAPPTRNVLTARVLNNWTEIENSFHAGQMMNIA
jgi:hypothetical protein